MKFLADMGISQSVVRWLNEQGHDTIHARELDPRATDAWLFERAREEGRTIITLDLDFGDILSATGYGRPSVVLFRLRRPRSDAVREHLKHVLDSMAEALIEGAIVIVEESRIRARRLPVESQP